MLSMKKLKQVKNKSYDLIIQKRIRVILLQVSYINKVEDIKQSGEEHKNNKNPTEDN